MDNKVDVQAELLANKIKHYLITTMGVTLDEASAEEFYRAFSLTLREEIMINWTACLHTYKKKHVRMLYYLCMEYMPGRLLGNNVTNIHAAHLASRVMHLLKRSYVKELQFESDPGLGNGGLGRLAACFMDSLATQQYPAIGYGLRYQYGIFDQEIWGGIQVERPENWLLHENPWEFRRDTHAHSVQYAGRLIHVKNAKGVEVSDVVDHEEVRALAYDLPIIGYREGADFTVNSLRLWTTKESPRNFQLQRYNAGLLDQAAENTCLTDVLYPNDNNETGKRTRLKQEFLLVSASLQDIFFHYFNTFPDIRQFADKVRIHINDTHPALVIAELQRLLLRTYDFSWQEAWDVVKTCCSFTNHTLLKESLEEWNEQRLHYLLPRQYEIIQRINLELCTAVRHRFPHEEERVRRLSIIEGGQVRMAHLAIYGSHRVNGVAALHSQLLKEHVFSDFYAMYPDKFLNVTNGVTQRRWLLHCNPQLAAFITERIGRSWITDFTQIRELARFAGEEKSQDAFLAIKRENKRRLCAFLQEKNPLRDREGYPTAAYPILDENALLDVHIKRIHEYKRQLMNILHAIMVYHSLKHDPQARKIKRTLLFGGKAAPGYAVAKNIIHFITCVARRINNDPELQGKLTVIFAENYNVSHAEVIIPAADLSEQISTAGMEASGTGNMKLAMNGALTIGTEDGANIEMHQEVTERFWPFGFGAKANEIADMRARGSYNPWDFYSQDPAIRRAVDSLRDRSFAETEEEHESHSSLYHKLLEAERADSFFVLYDLKSYFEAQRKVEDLYSEPRLWAAYALQNIAAMGKFSSDRSIHDYSQIWQLKPCPVDPSELQRVRAEYSEHDKCRIF